MVVKTFSGFGVGLGVGFVGFVVGFVGFVGFVVALSFVVAFLLTCATCLSASKHLEEH